MKHVATRSVEQPGRRCVGRRRERNHPRHVWLGRVKARLTPGVARPLDAAPTHRGAICAEGSSRRRSPGSLVTMG